MENILFDPITQDNPNVDLKFPASMAPAIFTSNGSKLFGTMFIASGEGPHPSIILLHGFPGNEVNFDLAHVFRRQGFNVFIFHYRGCWGSEGNYSWQHLLEDTEAAIEFLKSNFASEKFRVDGSRLILAGHSMGGFSAIFNSINQPGINNVISIAGFNGGAFGELLEVSRDLFDYSVQTMEPAIPFVRNAKAEFLLSELIKNKREWNLINHAQKLAGKNLLLIGARYDSIAPLNIHHMPMVKALGTVNPKIKSAVLETGHSFSDRRIELAKIISGWLSEIEFEAKKDE
jgi:pimeloyl-ACP methyl ester carboxylesterase